MEPRHRPQVCRCHPEGTASEEFQKILESEEAGIVIYRYVPSTRTNDACYGESYIIRNTKRHPATSEDFTIAFEQNKMNCPRCTKILEHAESLVKYIPLIESQDVVSICDHCRRKEQARSSCWCRRIVDKFLIGRHLEDRESLSHRIKLWLKQAQHMLRNTAAREIDESKSKILAHSDANLNVKLLDFYKSKRQETTKNVRRNSDVEITCKKCDFQKDFVLTGQTTNKADKDETRGAHAQFKQVEPTDRPPVRVKVRKPPLPESVYADSRGLVKRDPSSDEAEQKNLEMDAFLDRYKKKEKREPKLVIHSEEKQFTKNEEKGIVPLKVTSFMDISEEYDKSVTKPKKSNILKPQEIQIKETHQTPSLHQETFLGQESNGLPLPPSKHVEKPFAVTGLATNKTMDKGEARVDHVQFKQVEPADNPLARVKVRKPLFPESLYPDSSGWVKHDPSSDEVKQKHFEMDAFLDFFDKNKEKREPKLELPSEEQQFAKKEETRIIPFKVTSLMDISEEYDKLVTKHKESNILKPQEIQIKETHQRPSIKQETFLGQKRHGLSRPPSKHLEKPFAVTGLATNKAMDKDDTRVDHVQFKQIEPTDRPHANEKVREPVFPESLYANMRGWVKRDNLDEAMQKDPEIEPFFDSRGWVKRNPNLDEAMQKHIEIDSFLDLFDTKKEKIEPKLVIISNEKQLAKKEAKRIVPFKVASFMDISEEPITIPKKSKLLKPQEIQIKETFKRSSLQQEIFSGRERHGSPPPPTKHHSQEGPMKSISEHDLTREFIFLFPDEIKTSSLTRFASSSELLKNYQDILKAQAGEENPEFKDQELKSQREREKIKSIEHAQNESFTDIDDHKLHDIIKHAKNQLGTNLSDVNAHIAAEKEEIEDRKNIKRKNQTRKDKEVNNLVMKEKPKPSRKDKEEKKREKEEQARKDNQETRREKEEQSRRDKEEKDKEEQARKDKQETIREKEEQSRRDKEEKDKEEQACKDKEEKKREQEERSHRDKEEKDKEEQARQDKKKTDQTKKDAQKHDRQDLDEKKMEKEEQSHKEKEKLDELPAIQGKNVAQDEAVDRAQQEKLDEERLRKQKEKEEKLRNVFEMLEDLNIKDMEKKKQEEELEKKKQEELEKKKLEEELEKKKQEEELEKKKQEEEQKRKIFEEKARALRSKEKLKGIKSKDYKLNDKISKQEKLKEIMSKKDILEDVTSNEEKLKEQGQISATVVKEGKSERLQEEELKKETEAADTERTEKNKEEATKKEKGKQDKLNKVFSALQESEKLGSGKKKKQEEQESDLLKIKTTKNDKELIDVKSKVVEDLIIKEGKLKDETLKKEKVKDAVPKEEKIKEVKLVEQEQPKEGKLERLNEERLIKETEAVAEKERKVKLKEESAKKAKEKEVKLKNVLEALQEREKFDNEKKKKQEEQEREILKTKITVKEDNLKGSKEEKPREAVSAKEENLNDVASKEEKPKDLKSKDDKLKDMTLKEEKLKYVVSKVEKVKDVTSKDDKLSDTTTKNEKRKHLPSKEDKTKDVTSKEGEQEKKEKLKEEAQKKAKEKEEKLKKVLVSLQELEKLDSEKKKKQVEQDRELFKTKTIDKDDKLKEVVSSKEEKSKDIKIKDPKMKDIQAKEEKRTDVTKQDKLKDMISKDDKQIRDKAEEKKANASEPKEIKSKIIDPKVEKLERLKEERQTKDEEAAVKEKEDKLKEESLKKNKEKEEKLKKVLVRLQDLEKIDSEKKKKRTEKESELLKEKMKEKEEKTYDVKNKEGKQKDIFSKEEKRKDMTTKEGSVKDVPSKGKAKEGKADAGKQNEIKSKKNTSDEEKLERLKEERLMKEKEEMDKIRKEKLKEEAVIKAKEKEEKLKKVLVKLQDLEKIDSEKKKLIKEKESELFEEKTPKKGKKTEYVKNIEDKQKDVTLKEDKIKDVTSKEKKVNDVKSKEEKLKDVTSKKDKLKDVKSKEDRIKDLTSKDEKQRDITAKEETLNDVKLKEMKLKDVKSKEEKLKDVTVKEDKLIDIMSFKEWKMNDVTSKEEKVKDVKSKEEKQKNMLSKEEKLKDININYDVVIPERPKPILIFKKPEVPIKTKEIKFTKRRQELIIKLIRLKQSQYGPRERFKGKNKFELLAIDSSAAIQDYTLYDESDLLLELMDLEAVAKHQTDGNVSVIIGNKIFKQHLQYRPGLEIEPFKELEEINYTIVTATPTATKTKLSSSYLTSTTRTIYRNQVDPDVSSKGIIRYALSDRSFIDKGWTMLPTEKVVRKMNVYRMRPAHPEFDWFEHNKYKRVMQYDTGEILADFDDDGRGRWFYRSGKVALDYYNAEEINAQQRFVVYSSGEPDDRGRTRPRTVLATFDYLGNGVVFDHGGKIRLKYNQTEGIVLDRSIGPVSNWKWHTLNDPPVLQQVMIDTQMPYKDPNIVKLGGPDHNKVKQDNEEMLAIEFDNFIKEKSRKLTQKFKPFQIKMKALKINEYFSLRVLDQATVYLLFRDGPTNMKINIGMVLDHKEIVDTDTAEVGEVSNSLERLPARTDSLAALQRAVVQAQRTERARVRHERRLNPPEPSVSMDQLRAGLSRPMRRPLLTDSTEMVPNTQCPCRKPSTTNLYYNTCL